MEAKTMSDNSRRTVCRLAFLLICVLPVSLTCYRIFHPTTTSQWQQSIKANLGLSARIGKVQTPLPFTTVFHDVDVEDVELGPLLQLDQLKIVSGATNEVTIDEPVTIKASSLINMAERLRNSLLRTHAADKSWRISLNNATIIPGNPNGNPIGQELKVSPVVISIIPYPTITITNVEMQLENDPSGNVVRFSLKRSRGEEGFKETLELLTGETYLPCWVLHEALPDTRSLGPGCDFAGFLDLAKTESGWSGTMRGMFNQLDLASLMKPCGRNVEGLCDVLVRQCTFEGGQIKSFQVDLHCQSGMLDESTAFAANQFFGIQSRKFTGTAEFEKLAFSCDYADGALQLIADETGTIAQTRGESLLWLEKQYEYQLESLPRFLAGNLDPAKVDDLTVEVLSRFQRPPVRVANEGGNLH